MAAGAGDHDRDFRGDSIQIPAVRHAGHIGKVVLVPAPAGEPLALPGRICREEAPQRVQHVRKTARVRGELGRSQRLAEVQQVHVGIVEAGADEAAGEIGQRVALPGGGEKGLIVSDQGKASVLHREGAAQRQLAGIDPTVIVDVSHNTAVSTSSS